MSGECRLDMNSMKSQRETGSAQTKSETQTSTSDGHDQLKDILRVTSDKELLDELKTEETNMSGALEGDDKPLTKIQRVPEIMLQNENFKKYYYKPRELSIGPLHANSNNLLKKQLKVKLAARFVQNSGKTGEDLLREIKSKIEELKGYFDEEVIDSYNSESLARLLFLDGCSVLQFICSYLSDDLKDFKVSNGQAALIQQDLLLVENQIPFLVLKLLIYSCDQLIQKELRKDVLRFVITNAPVGYSSYTQDLNDLIDKDNRVHLLDLLRAVLLFGEENDNESNLIPRESSPHQQSYLCFPCLQGKRPTLSLNYNTNIRKMQRDGELYPSTKRSFRNVQELKSAGIKLKPSGICSLRAVSFTTRCFITGQLELPTLIVDNSTAPKLLNLVAYEMSLYNYKSNCLVTSYINFLDLLIDSEQDVKDLRKAHVLRNRLSSDAEVAQLFNSIGYNCLAAPRDAYLCVKNKIQSHCERRCAVWMAQVYHDQFSSPWTIVALLAALTALLLTAVQTWYAIHPKEEQ